MLRPRIEKCTDQYYRYYQYYHSTSTICVRLYESYPAEPAVYQPK